MGQISPKGSGRTPKPLGPIEARDYQSGLHLQFAQSYLTRSLFLGALLAHSHHSFPGDLLLQHFNLLEVHIVPCQIGNDIIDIGQFIFISKT